MAKEFKCDAIIGCTPPIIPGAEFQIMRAVGVDHRGKDGIHYAVGESYWRFALRDPARGYIDPWDRMAGSPNITWFPEEWPFDSRLQGIPLAVACIRKECLDSLSALPTRRWEIEDGVLKYEYEDPSLTIVRRIPLTPLSLLDGEQFLYWLGDIQSEIYLSSSWSRSLQRSFDQKLSEQREDIKQATTEELLRGKIIKPLETLACRAIFCAEKRSQEYLEAYKRLFVVCLLRHGVVGSKRRFNAGGNVMLRPMTWEDFYPQCEELRKQLMGESK
ncbi:hypothetical protein KKE03_00530 [Patescibacteria group bacterium]|nr:hypothetical protein [Patescibacteria group bacterium]